LNLTLEVLNKRDDGYHGLRSVMVPVALYDEIDIARDGSGWQFESSDPQLAGENLVERAVQAAGVPTEGFHVVLHKRIPVGAGLGGGSSDAAAVLSAASDGRLGKPAQIDYLGVARSLGSDVPFFLCGTAAIVEGTGERITALGSIPAWGATILKPPVSISTARAYALLDRAPRASRPRNTSVTLRCAEALQRADFDGVTALLQNDFEPVIASEYPEVAEALALLRNWSRTPALLTGSGSCVFTLWETHPEKPLALPPGFERFDAAFCPAEAWRGQP
jgi:4-diphosphocytidyl-2-C-methyl-D-erythritol kinase